MRTEHRSGEPQTTRHIAVIGSGIAGLSAAWLLAQEHRVTLYEAEGRPGGHSHTVLAPTGDGFTPVDTGFIVFNERNYPNLTALFEHLEVATQRTKMSFSASLDGGRLEYSSAGLNGLVGQRRNSLNPRFWLMVRDIYRFYGEAPKLLQRPDCETQTLGDYLDGNGYSDAFIEDHLLPMGAAIWSTTAKQMRAYPLAAFVRFFIHHGLLDLVDRPKWRTVVGGSTEYVKKLLGRLDDVRLSAGAVEIRRERGGVTVVDSTGQQQWFNDVVIATHADQARRLLADADEMEASLLGAFDYTDNLAVLHSDTALMPQRKRVWSCWNYIGDSSDTGERPLCVSYWMNELQTLDPAHPLFVTLNPTREIASEKFIRSFHYTHPLFDTKAVEAQQDLWRLQGSRHTFFAGSYFGHGFHEDALQAGLAAAEAVGGVRRPWRVAGESNRIALPPLPCGGRMSSALYTGKVFHARTRPRRHSLTYRVFSLLLDLDEVEALSQRLRLFGHNRAAVFSFHDADHGDGTGKLNDWVAGQLANAGLTLHAPKIEMLCYPRIFGYVFNPLTVYFCSDGDVLSAILYEVHNTFGERRTYVIPVEAGAQQIEQSCAKELYVSPFVPMDCVYRFHIEPPGEKILVRIDETDGEGMLLRASFAGERQPLTDRTLLRALFGYPLMTLKVTAAIHWEAIKLFAKGVPVFRHKPAKTRIASTVVER